MPQVPHQMVDIMLAEVPVQGRQSDFSMTVTLWRVTGIDGILFPTKMLAEIAARTTFPKDEMGTNYGRISYVRFHNEEGF